MMLRMLPWAASLVARTLRFRVHGTLPAHGVIAFWHGKMFVGWYLARAHTPVALVSLSKDGDILSDVLRHWGYDVERGSSSRSGLEALERAVERVRRGTNQRVVITPDGPRGPSGQLKRGAFLAASMLGCPVHFCRIKCRNAKVLRSWDKFEIPLPFSRVDVTIVELPLEGFPQDIAAQHAWLNRCVAEHKLHASD